MQLSTGTRLGPYEVIAPVGAGGMGEVYRARDTRLDRIVAIKVLNESLASSPDLKQRFEREARAISQLQHPHICTLFDVGEQDGTNFLVIEYLEGETLAERIKRGALPLDQAVKTGAEIARALEHAHRAGIVHRDLKPGNVMLTKSGAKLLDFGLAKRAAMATATGANTAPLLSASATMTSPSPHASPLTMQGSIIGTIQYMSPEQIEGREPDARSDIFALGAVLYEAVTGKRAFDGKSQIKVASAILEDPVEPVSALRPDVPPALARLIDTCLQKNPDDRLQSAQDVVVALRWVAEATPAPARGEARGQQRGTLAWAGWAVAIVLGLAAVFLLFQRSQASLTLLRAEIAPPPKMTFDAVGDLAGAPVLSPQGDALAFVARSADGERAIWVRPLNQLDARRLDGTEGASHPFWSPDGKSLGFFAGTKLSRISVTGGPIIELASIVNPRGASWGKGNVILFCPDYRGPLMQVSANGGAASPATTLDIRQHTTHRWPWFLPDGKHFLYLATNHTAGRKEENGIYFAALGSHEARLLVATDAGAQYASGYLLYRAQTAVVAQPFDASSGRLTGQAIPIVNRVRHDAGVWRTIFTASDNGVLAYQPGTSSVEGTQLTWYDRSGKPLGTVGEREKHSDPIVSPDGKQLAVLEGDPYWDLWVYDLQRGTKRRLTFNEGTISEPSWSPDGKFLVYTVAGLQGGGALEIRTKAANGTGAERTLSETARNYRFPAFSPDGKYLTYVVGEGSRKQTLWAVPLSGDRTPIAVVRPPSEQSNIFDYSISPNGHWVAYLSDETQQRQIYVAPFPAGDGKWQVSTGGGSLPAWRGDGKEIFYKSFNDEFYAVPFAERGREAEVGKPAFLFKMNVYGGGVPYSVTRDGQRFILNKSEEEGYSPLYLVTNWPAELKK